MSHKKLVVIISGQPRFTKLSSKNIKKMLIEPLVSFGYDVHLLMNLWSSTSFDKFNTTLGKEVPSSVLREAQSGLRPCIVEINPSHDFFARREENKIQVSLREAPSYESQYLCLSRAAKMTSKYCEQHNFVPSVAIRTRADLLFLQPLTKEVVERAENDFLVPNRQGFGWAGSKPPNPWKTTRPWLPDQFWIGPWNQMQKMCSFHDFWHEGLRVHGDNIEKMLYAFSQENGIKINTFDCVIKIEKTVNNK